MAPNDLELSMAICDLSLLPLSEVLRIVPTSRASLYRWISQGSFPSAVKIGPKRVAWRASDIEAWAAGLNKA